jgi:hypothetical protein
MGALLIKLGVLTILVQVLASALAVMSAIVLAFAGVIGWKWYRKSIR